MSEVKKDNEGLPRNTAATRRTLLKIAFLVAIAAIPFLAFFFRKKREYIPVVEECEIVFSKPKNVDYGIFLPNKEPEDKEALGLSSITCSDAEIIAIRFVEFTEDNYCIAVDLKFVSEKPDAKKDYKFELIAYNENGTGIAYTSGQTRDMRIIDRDAEGRMSPSVLIREMKVRPVYSLDVIISQDEYKKLGRLSLFCTTARS